MRRKKKPKENTYGGEKRCGDIGAASFKKPSAIEKTKCNPTTPLHS